MFIKKPKKLELYHNQKKDLAPKQNKNDSQAPTIAKDKVLEKLLPVKELFDKDIQKLLGECSAYFERIVGMGMAKPMQSTINIFAPNITQNVSIVSDSNNTIDSNNTTDSNNDHGTYNSNCGNSSYSYRTDTKIKVKTNIHLTENHQNESHTNIGRIGNDLNYGKLKLNGKSPLYLED